MSLRIMSHVWSIQNISTTEKLILLAIADHADDSGYAYPGLNGLSDKVGVSHDRIRAVVSKMEEDGLIQREARFAPNGRQTSNAYRILLPPCPQGGDPLESKGGTPLPSRGSIYKEDLTPNLTLKRKGEVEVEVFEELWKAYPYRHIDGDPSKKTKGSKGQTLALFRSLLHHKDETRRPPSKEVLLAIFQKMESGNHKFIPDMKRWLEKMRWMDEEYASIQPTNPISRARRQRFIQKAQRILHRKFGVMTVPREYEHYTDGTEEVPVSLERVDEGIKEIENQYNIGEADPRWILEFAEYMVAKKEAIKGPLVTYYSPLLIEKWKKEQ